MHDNRTEKSLSKWSLCDLSWLCNFDNWLICSKLGTYLKKTKKKTIGGINLVSISVWLYCAVKEEKKWNLLWPLGYCRFYLELRFYTAIEKQRFCSWKRFLAIRFSCDHVTINFNRMVGCEIGPRSFCSVCLRKSDTWISTICTCTDFHIYIAKHYEDRFTLNVRT